MDTKYSEYIKLNKIILIAIGVSIIISALVSHIISDQADYVNTTYTLVTDYLVYFSTFSGLYYLDHKKKYILPSGQVDKKRLRHDLVKIIASLGFSEIVYTVTRWFLHYYLLTIEYDAYLASIISQIISTMVYMLTVNLGVKMTRLYRNET